MPATNNICDISKSWETNFSVLTFDPFCLATGHAEQGKKGLS
eukprot:CAMPEP_0115288584 /NCGR_PEP_ID=MMETSP0270-20121206/63050_1 /TAXON_ID=71861 /ORGANISM="Scrippsiella trochoidea, Strain CCMP3099" /LENGTH=41 /DNA_ID= /DNA_START= /DNA_END= /DNA_ORIENTATION=